MYDDDGDDERDYDLRYFFQRGRCVKYFALAKAYGELQDDFLM